MLLATVIPDGKRGLSETQPAAKSAAAGGEPILAAPSQGPRVPSQADLTHTRETSAASPAEPTRASEPELIAGATLSPERAREVRRSGAPRPRDPERYEILGEHGRGGLGRVSRAHDHDLGRNIAIKELISRGTVSEVRFLREALITARLEHPGIVPIYEAGRWPDGTPFYAMKLVAGRPLRELIAERTTLEQRIGLLHHVIAVADAIAYAHGRNIIHRDLKPANVIVGDFGETIVIDWGLAKDLTASEDSVVGGAPSRASGDELTSTGIVLGTPAYMAPEQARGEQVDQRADVFAIGAMLWDLCALQKLVPTEPQQRHLMLCRAGIDKDLVTIIDKALDPDPGRRYPDAGALAADLKAFKSGSRIAARSYSLFAMLAHWTRHHRALALSVATAIALAAAGIATYVWGIAAERDRAHAATNALILKQAELLLHSDPTAAFEILQNYEGAEINKRAMLVAEARGLGLASLHASPHKQSIYFAHGVPDGTLVTVSVDGTIARTSLLGSTRVIARGVVWQHTFAYSDVGHMLAYACRDTALCLLDVQTERLHTPPANTSSFAPVAIAFSPGGQLLAAVSFNGDVSIWQFSEDGLLVARAHSHVDEGTSIGFVNDQTFAIQARGHVHIWHLDATGALTGPVVLPIEGGGNMTASKELQLIAMTTSKGELVVIDSQVPAVTQRQMVCKGPLNQVAILPDRRLVGYACQDGDAGTWDLRQSTQTVLAHIEGGVATLAASADDRYLIFGGNSGNVLTYDFSTQLQKTYLGHAARITLLTPPSRTYPYIVSGDAVGALRTWSPPDSTARVVIKTSSRLYRTPILSNHGPLIAVGNSSVISWWADNGTSGELRDHNPLHSFVVVSARPLEFAAYGVDDEIELWLLGGSPSRRVLKTGHGMTTTAVFTQDGDRLIVGSKDGSVQRWSLDPLTHHDPEAIHESMDFIRMLQHSDTAVVGGASGALWLSSKDGLEYLGNPRAAPGRLAVRSKDGEGVAAVVPMTDTAAVSPDSRWVAVGTSQGAVELYDLTNRQSFTLSTSGAWIEHLAFSQDSEELAVATDTRVSLIPVGQLPATYASATANTFAPSDDGMDISAGYIAYSPDGKWLALTVERSGIWFKRRADSHWNYLYLENTDIKGGLFFEDSNGFVATDARGQTLLIDMQAIAHAE